jgi:adenine-specific DNA methylase
MEQYIDEFGNLQFKEPSNNLPFKSMVDMAAENKNFMNQFNFPSADLNNVPVEISQLPIASVPNNFLNYRFQDARTPFTPFKEGIETLKSNVSSGIGKGFDLGKTVGSGILSAIAGVPFLGNVLTGITSQFENRPLGAGVIDEFGNVYDPEELNKLNALGGYYTDPARSARRRSKRIAKMLERQKLGKKISLKNLAKLQAQEKAQREMQEKATKAMAAQNKAEGRGGYQSDFAQDSGFMGGSGTAAEMGSFKKGGLAGLL